jgi:energy-coupling factor transporter ATP-binding protein EcfA2
MSYFEPGYHRPGDPPFCFPPSGTEPKIGSNLVEIEGKNGTGKTTLLNVLALSLGYLDKQKELETKPLLKRKLQDLKSNPTLEYSFRISCVKPEPLDLRIDRKKGQEPIYFLNGKPTGSDTLSSKFDVIFLTEDDPSKVVSHSREKLADYLNNLDHRLVTLQESLNENLLDVVEFRDIESRMRDFEKEIKKRIENIATRKDQQARQEALLKQLERKQEIQRNLELLRNESKITGQYQELRGKYERLKGKEDANLAHKLNKERAELGRIEGEIKEYDMSIIQICSSLKTYEVEIDGKRLLKNDCAELNQLMHKMEPEKSEQRVILQMVDDMIAIFQRYSEDVLVPLVEKPVKEALKDLFRLKVKFGSDRVPMLAKRLREVMDQKRMAIVAQTKTQERIDALQQKRKDLEEIQDLEKEFIEAEKAFISLQTALQEDKGKMIDEWGNLKSVQGDPVSVRSELEELKVAIGTEEGMKDRYEENLRNLNESRTKKPKYEKNENQLKSLNEQVAKLRENLYQWTRILSNPIGTRREFESAKQRVGFSLSDYEKFVKAVGEYLGDQFEPVLFDLKFHNIKFFDIEKETFITDTDREIPINKLSQGQNKIATLTGIFKKMDPNKKKIVLVDEIADLDPENLQEVKKRLREKCEEGSLLLAVLVRPSHEPAQVLSISGWG